MSGPKRQFTSADQEWFARLSGDANPLHLSATFASRTYPGAPVVHGMHALVWALDQRCSVEKSVRIGGIQAIFIKPILLGDGVTVEGDGQSVRLNVRGETMAVATLTQPLSRTPIACDGGVIWAAGQPPLDRAGEDLSGKRGKIELPATIGELAGKFPHLAQAASPEFVCGLAGVSTLVGMVCPGLHGVLSEVAATAAAPGGRCFAFSVVQHDRRFSRVEIAVNARGIAGTVVAFAGGTDPPPADDPAIRALIPPGAFTGQAPLIIGATSGLGTATARLLAAGGANPLLGYCDQADAATVLQTVHRLGDGALVPFDVTTPAEGLKRLAAMGWRGNEAYYFASPRIFRRRIEPYQAADLRDFLRIFVDGFYETVLGLMDLRDDEPLTIFYPSTVALDAPLADLFEYQTAKRIGEELCQRLRDNYRCLTIISARLPRIATRQTRTFVKARAEMPEAVMAPLVREVQTARPVRRPP